MELRLPDSLLNGLELTEAQWRLGLAFGLYLDERLTLGRAAQVAGLSKPAFLDELGKRKIAIHYDQRDLEGDLSTIAALQDKRAGSTK